MTVDPGNGPIGTVAIVGDRKMPGYRKNAAEHPRENLIVRQAAVALSGAMRGASTSLAVVNEADGIFDAAALFSGWEVELIQLGRGPFRTNGVRLPLVKAMLTCVRVGRTAVLRGISPAGQASLCMTLPRSRPMRAGSRTIHGIDSLIIGDQATVEIVLPEGCSFAMLSIALPARRTSSQQAEAVPRRGTAVVCEQTRQGTELLADCASRVLALGRRSWSDAELRNVGREIGEALSRRSSRCISWSAKPLAETGDHPSRRRAVERARVHMASHLGEPINLSDLCAATKVGARTLENGFREAYGLGPMAFLRSARLCRVHGELVNLKSGTETVASTARRWSFTHMGQFSKDYRIQFGEKPSATLARGRLRLRTGVSSAR